MKFSVKKLGVTVGFLSFVAGPVVGLTATQAGAIPPVAHPKQDLESAGSDTIYWVTKALDIAYNKNTAAGQFNTDKDHAGPIPPVNIAPFPTSYSTKSDAHCGVKTYDSSDAAHTPPNGSSAGIAALVADGSTGCIDYARSSRGRKAGDVANIDFWAFGLDALGVGDFPGTHAPANGLTQTQLIKIYTCNPATGAPYISDWHTINPSAPKGSLIKKYSPQTQSGSYSFFNSQLLNGATVDANCNASHLSTFIEEHDAAEVATADKPNALFPMSYAQWIADSHGKTPDLRNGIIEMKINGVKPSPKSVNTCSGCPGHFIGTRYVYNVTMPTEPDYTDVLRFVGADNSGAGYICSGQHNMLSSFGFQSLPSGPTGTTSSGTNITLASNCRVNPAPV